MDYFHHFDVPLATVSTPSVSPGVARLGRGGCSILCSKFTHQCVHLGNTGVLLALVLFTP